MSIDVLGLQEIDQTTRLLVGGKAANLSDLFHIDEIRVPDGFCITTEAFQKTMEGEPALGGWLSRLAVLDMDQRDELVELCGSIRSAIEGITIPQRIKDEIVRYLSNHGEKQAYAIRSSSTVEDSSAASFAGQLDSYLNVAGTEDIVRHIKKCWASLYSERAVMYGIQNGIDYNTVGMAVIVQKMIAPWAAGVLFTADPLTSNRKVTSIDAAFGLGEALVSGLVNPDHYKVRDGAMLEKRTSRAGQVLTDGQIQVLESLGRQIEAHFGFPVDVEWCLVDDEFYIVQSRAITTLYPIPEGDHGQERVYVSVGHQQMMTDAMRPLGLSFYLLTTHAPMRQAGGRLFVDITAQLSTAEGRAALLNTLGKSDPLTGEALMTIMERAGFERIRDIRREELPSEGFLSHVENDPEIVQSLIRHHQSSLERLEEIIETLSGIELFDFILGDIQELQRLLFDPQSMGIITAAMDATEWINEKMQKWLGEYSAADTLSQSASSNITAQMGLELLDVADVVRRYPEVLEYLERVREQEAGFLTELESFEGGRQVQEVFNAFLCKYGMRCSGEIDLTRTRWIEQPTKLIPIILSHVKHFGPHASCEMFNAGLQEAQREKDRLLDRLKQLPAGEQKVAESSRMIELVRNYIGYREYPKYSMISRYFIYKQALLKEAAELVRAGVIQDREDVYYLTFEEFRDVVRTHDLDYQVIKTRKDEYKLNAKLTPPRVITSNGEVIQGDYKRQDLPSGAIPGLAVSSGVIEGRARVILDMQNANLEEGDILVTSFTDPSWTPLFVSIRGLVTEVGGLMTHGAVIAREYGLPAVVGVRDATKLIQDGQQIRVHGTKGYVEILDPC